MLCTFWCYGSIMVLVEEVRNENGVGFRSLNRQAWEPLLSKWPSRTKGSLEIASGRRSAAHVRPKQQAFFRHSSISQIIIHKYSNLQTDAMQKLRRRFLLLFYESAHPRERVQVLCQTYRAFWWWSAWRTRRKRWGLCGWWAFVALHEGCLSSLFVVLCCVVFSVTLFFLCSSSIRARTPIADGQQCLHRLTELN